MGGQNGPIPLARISPTLQLPFQQGYIGTGGPAFNPPPIPVFELPGPMLGTAAPPTLYLGPPFAPGQGGDTPGGGGGLCSQTREVETDWFTDGVLNPQAIKHNPGVTSWTNTGRRSKA